MVEMQSIYIRQRGYFMKDGFDTKYITIRWIEQILHHFEDQKIANFFNLEQVNFRVTLIICRRVRIM